MTLNLRHLSLFGTLHFSYGHAKYPKNRQNVSGYFTTVLLLVCRTKRGRKRQERPVSQRKSMRPMQPRTVLGKDDEKKKKKKLTNIIQS